MTYERQRETALRLVKKYGVNGILQQEVITPDQDKPWNNTVTTQTTSVHLVAFADDGVTFINHNITGDVRLLTVVSQFPLDIGVGDLIVTTTNTFTVKLAKPLDPDLTGAILWAVLAQ